MMKKEKDIHDDEIRVIGKGNGESKFLRKKLPLLLGILLAIIIVIIVLVLLFTGKKPRQEESYFEPEQEAVITPENKPEKMGHEPDSLQRGFTEISDTTINDIPLRIYIPHNAVAVLEIGALDKTDTSIIYCAQAADIRRDNHRIVGAFVLKGKPLAWGLSKKGYCAIINDRITVGVAENSTLFEEATEKEGYFFRQYPLVDNGRLVENEPKNKSVRRALCDRNGEIMAIETLTAESFHDFAQALEDIGVTNAIYLVGSNSYGWAVDENGERIELGLERRNTPKYTSYIVWRRK